MANDIDSSKKVYVCVQIANAGDDHGVGSDGNGVGSDHGAGQTRDEKVENVHEEMEEDEEMHETDVDLENTLLRRDTNGKQDEKDTYFYDSNYSFT